MAQINDEQVLELIKMNARDYWTIAEENLPRFQNFGKVELSQDPGDDVRTIQLTPDNFVSACITQFIELKRGKNFGAVKIHSKDDKKEEKPEEKPDYTIRDPESPMTDGQKAGIEKLMNIPGAPKLINTYRETHDIEGSWDTANKGQASEMMDLLIQLGKQKKGGD